MFVVKRNGHRQEVVFDKIYNRIKYLVADPYVLNGVNIHTLAQVVIQGLFDGINTTDIDSYSANVAASLSIKHRDYGVLAGRISVNNHHKNTLTSFKDKMDLLYLRKDTHDKVCPLIDDAFYKFVKKNQKEIEKAINYNRDYLFDFFAFKTLERSYLLKLDNKVIERPQDMFMRVAIFLHMNPKSWKSKTALEKVLETYDMLSQKYFTHATPTLFNAGSIRPQLASCFLLFSEDSLEGIMKTATDCATISKWSGGIGFHCSSWRSKDALIRGTNGRSNGIIPFLRIFNDVARAFNQGGKRSGSFAVYIEPHHPDIMGFLALRRNTGEENLRARDLFLALWVSDLFMERVEADGVWSTFDADECPGLTDVYGDEYKKLYLQYESEKKYKEQYQAREVWKAVFTSQKESGQPYILYKDHVNRSNNQANLGTIKSSNLCAEIVLFSGKDEYAVCNLASICLPMFVEDTHSQAELESATRRELDHEFPHRPRFNYKKLAEVVGIVTRNLNQVIDRNWYPVPETHASNMRHRPIGIGVQGLADVFFKFKTTYDSEVAKDLNRRIFETIYYAALSTSSTMSREIYKSTLLEFENKPTIKLHKKEYTRETLPKTIGAYSSYEGSPMSQGKFHFELRGLTTSDLLQPYDWESLRAHISQFGTRNSMLVALMPTASTSQLMGNIESIEPLTSNVFKRNTMAGEFIVVNKYLIHDLEKLGLWNSTTENYIKLNKGSIQSIDGIPDELKRRYRTVWEMSQKHIIDLAADRQHFVDQSQSMNLFIEDLTFSKFNSMHFYGWKQKLKTGCYYLRSQPAIEAQKFTVDVVASAPEEEVEVYIPSVNDEEICLVCSS
jgi:ribonucleoside-diphosphate reductase alpha chain